MVLATRELLRRLVVPVYAPIFLGSLGLAMLVPVLPLYLIDLGIGLEVTAVVLAAVGFGNMVGSLPTGAGLARFGERSMLLGAFVVLPVAIALMGLVAAAVVLVVLQVVAGVASCIIRLSRQTAITRRVPIHQRGRVMALIGGSFRVALVIGPFLGGWLVDAVGFRTAFVSAGLVTAVGLVPALLSERRDLPLLPAVAEVGAATMGLVETLRGYRRRLVAYGGAPLLVMAVRDGRFVIMPLVLDDLGVGATGVGAIMTASTVADLVLFPVAGWVMDRFGRLRAMVPAFGLFAVGLVVLALAQTPGGVVVAGIVMGIGNGLSSGAILTLGSDGAPADAAGPFLATMSVMTGLGRVVGPLVVGLVGAAFGLSVSAMALAVVMVIAIAWLVILIGEPVGLGSSPDPGGVPAGGSKAVERQRV